MVYTPFLIIIMQALFALTFPLGKVALQYTGALFLIGLRMTLGGVMLLWYYLCCMQRQTIARLDWPLLCKTAFFAIYLAYVPEFWSLSKMSSLKNNLLWSSLPFFSALLGFYLYDQHLTRNKWLGLFIGFVGMLPVMLKLSPEEVYSGTFLHMSLADLMMVVAVMSSAYGLFLMKQLLSKGYHIILMNGTIMLLGGLMSLATVAIFPPAGPLYVNFGQLFLYATLLVIVSNIAGYAIYGYLLKRYSIVFLTLTGFLCPVFGALFSTLFLGEQLHYQYGITFVLVMLALLIFYQDELQA